MDVGTSLGRLRAILIPLLLLDKNVDILIFYVCMYTRTYIHARSRRMSYALGLETLVISWIYLC